MILLSGFTIGSLIFAFFMMLFIAVVVAGILTALVFLFDILTANEPTLQGNKPTNYSKLYRKILSFFAIIIFIFGITITIGLVF